MLLRVCPHLDTGTAVLVGMGSLGNAASRLETAVTTRVMCLPRWRMKKQRGQGSLCGGWPVVTPRGNGGCYLREVQEIEIWFLKSRSSHEFRGVFYFASEGSLKLFMKWTDFLRFRRNHRQWISGQRCKIGKSNFGSSSSAGAESPWYILHCSVYSNVWFYRISISVCERTVENRSSWARPSPLLVMASPTAYGTTATGSTSTPTQQAHGKNFFMQFHSTWIWLSSW